MGFCPRHYKNEDPSIAYFEAQSRGFSICCLRFTRRVAEQCARLTSGWWLAFAGREFNPLDSNEKFQLLT